MTPETPDTIIIGGGPAGLQAALTLGRMRHRVLVLDAGDYRNDPADAMHNLVGHDGWSPAEYRAAARSDLAAYETVTVREARAESVAASPDGFVVRLAGGEQLPAHWLILATGLRDTLPETPGLAEVFGSTAAHCPYCHGFEYADRPVGLLGTGPHTPRVALLMHRLTDDLTVLADGAEPAPETAAVLDRIGARVRTEPVLGVRPAEDGVVVELDGGDPVEVAGLMVAPTYAQAAPFAEQLGLELQDSGCIRVDPLGRTSLPRVYAAGDLAHTDAFPMPLSSVANAIATGLATATAVDGDDIMRQLGLPAVPWTPRPGPRQPRRPSLRLRGRRG
ncbi:MAG: NAD(P)/FAD-dependent oxidoreductase [Nocardioides sp.]|uniref:NAD(P)/FAD-dependent oxidoreductase n=1 Tax=Nocardioides sp. TaxID=35761 RepID=UPI0039E2FC26